MAITVSGTSITFPDATTQTTAGKTGTVTSVATGNGLSGGTITTTGTLAVACPSWNSVGSYTLAKTYSVYPSFITAGSDYSAGTGTRQIASTLITSGCGGLGNAPNNSLSGTWKWMARTAGTDSSGDVIGLVCRVS